MAEVKADLVSSLEDSNFKVFDHVPSKLHPPCIVVAAAEGTYLQPGQTFGEWEINLAVYLTVASGTNERELERMDEMLTAVLPHFEGDQGNPWTTEVGTPIYYSISGSDYLACRIAASNQFKLTGA